MGLDSFLHVNSKRVKRDAEAADPDVEDAKWRHKDDIAIYWRKANHIHNWFVNNVQDGEDDCGVYEVDVEQLAELAHVCAEVMNHSKLVPGKVVSHYEFDDGGKMVPVMVDGMVIEDPTVAEELLPVAEGFFFGGTDYEEWYYEDTKRTFLMLSAMLEHIKQDPESQFSWHKVHEDEPDWHVRFTYTSSW